MPIQHNDDASSLPVAQIGDVIPDEVGGGGYKIRALIGKGGMGEVFKAERVGKQGREIVAIKLMSGNNANDPNVRLRFHFEGIALKEIRHPNVVPVLATGVRRKDGAAWMTMPLLRGQTIAEIIAEHGSLPMPWAIKIIRDVCRGLQAIHSVAIIHRDIKPANLFLTTDAVLQILDLGASRFLQQGILLTTKGFQLGTVPYMSPEQIRNRPLDGRSDLFSATVVLYELITGRHPFAFDGAMPGWFELCSRIVGHPHVPANHERLAPWLPSWLVEVLDQGLAKEPEKRFRNAKDMEDALTAALNRLQVELEHIEPLKTFAETLAPQDDDASLLRSAQEPAEPAQDGPRGPDAPGNEPQPRTTVPMAHVVNQPQPRTTVPMAQVVNQPPPRTAAPQAAPSPGAVRHGSLPHAITDQVPAGDGDERVTMLPGPESDPRVSHVALKRSDDEPHAPAPSGQAPAPPSPPRQTSGAGTVAPQGGRPAGSRGPGGTLVDGPARQPAQPLSAAPTEPSSSESAPRRQWPRAAPTGVSNTTPQPAQPASAGPTGAVGNLAPQPAGSRGPRGTLVDGPARPPVQPPSAAPTGPSNNSGSAPAGQPQAQAPTGVPSNSGSAAARHPLVQPVGAAPTGVSSSPGLAAAASSSDVTIVSSPARRRRPAVIVLCAALFAVTVGTIGLIQVRGRSSSPSSGPSLQEPPSVASGTSVVVPSVSVPSAVPSEDAPSVTAPPPEAPTAQPSPSSSDVPVPVTQPTPSAVATAAASTSARRKASPPPAPKPAAPPAPPPTAAPHRVFGSEN
jgi:serine/threonine-protein kinase